MYGIGSILQNITTTDARIWSSGFIYPEKTITCTRTPLAIRGKLSLDFIECTNKNNIPLGDGGLILDRVYPNHTIPIYDVGIVPHYSDVVYLKGQPIESWDLCKQYNVLFINPCDSPTNVIPKILQCKKIITSSLHGVVTCDAYDIDHALVAFNESNIGLHDCQQSFKFKDYYSIYNKTFQQPRLMEENIAMDDVMMLCNENKRYYKDDLHRIKVNLWLSLFDIYKN